MIVGQSGSGKSYYLNMYMKNYKKAYKNKRPIYFFIRFILYAVVIFFELNLYILCPYLLFIIIHPYIIKINHYFQNQIIFLEVHSII